MVLGYDDNPSRDGLNRMTEARLALDLGRSLPERSRSYADACDWGHIAQMALIPSGRDRGLHPVHQRGGMISLALTTSDFTRAFGTYAAAFLQTIFANAMTTHLRLGTVETFTDFKNVSLVEGVDFPELLETDESGSISQGAIADSGEVGRLVNYARIITITPKMLINDGEKLIPALLKAAAQRVLDLEDALAWETLTSGTSNNGPTMRDGSQFFATSRGNLASSATAISTASIGVARGAMGSQTGPGGTAGVAVPRVLICNPTKIALAEEALASFALGADPASRIYAVPSPRVIDNDWYLAAGPKVRPAMVFGRLEGSPIAVSQPDWATGGLAVKVRHDFSATCVEPRSLYRNPGA